MQSSFNKLIVVLSFIVLTACSSHSSQNDQDNSSAMRSGSLFFPLPVPLKASYQDEVNLLRINQLIADKSNVDNKQRAILLYERGLIYDRMGLSAHSRFDFSQAIQLDPTFAEAYNSLGLYLLMGEAYDEAFEAFDSAIELSDDVQFSYLHRAVGLSLVGRYDAAKEDIERFYALDKTDPYRVLWRYLIDYKVDPQLATEQLKSAQAPADNSNFAWGIVDVMNGKISEQAFFENISNGITTNEELAQRLCEAYYYLAHWHINHNNINQGIYYLKLSLAANVQDFIEYKYALLDLKAIQTQLQHAELKKAEAKIN
ncbi:lipoprotein NlpI [Psychromonas sp. RZ22]|uniref:lipoprotein NlpI n=1 Tax=Psychromonas algarum TaxID=2555643 RepID=UPI001067E3AE|nr:lipoprotein NlpI [Psychromonas sp. RZ22]TEW56128.1 lipoprotein NlpI [Psychromonas sp. RZ22]